MPTVEHKQTVENRESDLHVGTKILPWESLWIGDGTSD